METKTNFYLNGEKNKETRSRDVVKFTDFLFVNKFKEKTKTNKIKDVKVFNSKSKQKN